MIRFLKFHIAVLLGVIALCSGCSAPEPPPPTPPESDVPWVYEPDAVVLRISADERLNEHEGEPSSLMLCVYELATREGVDKRLASPEGFAELRAFRRFRGDEPEALFGSRSGTKPFSGPGRGRPLDRGDRRVLPRDPRPQRPGCRRARAENRRRLGAVLQRHPPRTWTDDHPHTPRPGGTDGRRTPADPSGTAVLLSAG